MTFEAIDTPPEDRADKIEAARQLLDAPPPIDPAALRDACTILLALSDDPGARLIAQEVLRHLDDTGMI